MPDFVKISDSIDSDSSVVAASSKAVNTVANAVLEAAKNASEGSDLETDIYEPLLGEVKHEIGSWWFSIDGSIPTGGLPHLGHLVSRSTYGTGWTWIETNKTVVTDEEWLAYAESHNGTCPYYSYGDGSTTFRTPSYDQSFLKVLASISGTGSVEEAGLPNITGMAEIAMNSYLSGAFYSQSKASTYNFTSTSGSNALQFDASISNPIYGNSDTVTPQNYGIIVGIYLVGAVSSPIGETDAAGLLNGLNTLESRTGALENGDGFNSIGKAEIVGWGMPDYTAGVKITVSTDAYVAPSNGWLMGEGNLSGSGARQFLINGVFVGEECDDGQGICYPMSKGDEITVSGSYGNNYYFYPCKGA